MKIYTINEKQLDAVVEGYMDYVTNPKSGYRLPPYCVVADKLEECEASPERALYYDNSMEAMMNNKGVAPPIVWNLKKPQYDTTKAHFISLIHILYLRYISSETGNFKLNTGILQDIYPNYKYMLDVLCHNLVLSRTAYPYKNFYRYYYTIHPNITVRFPIIFKECKLYPKKVEKDLDKLTKIQSQLHRENMEQAKQKTSPTFVDRYSQNVRRLVIADKEGLSNFMETHEFEKEHSKLYYTHTSEKMLNKANRGISSFDANGRFHHIGTQLPRELRQYTNIKYIIDCKNSHPLLFNYIILEYFFNKDNIDIKYDFFKDDLYFLICSFINNNNPNCYHYFTKDLCNYLKDNDISDDVCAKVRGVKRNVWQYMYATSHGQLWDDFVGMFHDLSRDEIKRTMFQNLFYSYNKNVREGNEFAKVFQGLYPDVMTIIRYCKRKFHSDCTERGATKPKTIISKKTGQSRSIHQDTIQLAHVLMRLESSIFTEILTRLFRKRDLHCVGIHDAVAVLDDKYLPVYVQNMMIHVYKEYGLIPTLDVKFF